jgi:outer membrane receptor for ferrienterochelin and colicin
MSKKLSTRRFLILAFFAFICIEAGSQTLKGRVVAIEGGKETPLVGANVFFGSGSNGVVTDANGIFAITRHDSDSHWLYATLTGYRTDSLHIHGQLSDIVFKLVEGVALDEIVIEDSQKGMVFNRLTAGKIEVITKTGLAKMACCNLSESFENSATVTVGFTDAISGAKQVQLLGLSGLYSQLLTENVPTYRGLLSTFGWSYVPGTWLESIQISKGASSVVNGYESVSGQINLEMKKPNYTEPLFINLYSDQLGRYEANITAATKVAKDLYTGLLIHGSTETEGIAGERYQDYNEDTFLDMPHSKLLNIYNRWFYLSENGIQSRTNLHFLADNRMAGQNDHTHGEGHTVELYKTDIDNKAFSVENKTGFTVGEEKSIGIITSFNHANENLVYGKKTFNGAQNSFYGNALFTNTADSTHHFTLGLSFTYDKFNTVYEDRLTTGAWYSLIPQTQHTDIDRSETIPGAFAEYTFTQGDKFTFIIGLREDWNSRFGWLFTPRANVRYSIVPELVLRASAGRGYRSPNAIADNIGLLATSRRFHVEGQAIDNLDIERAWNYGANVAAYIPFAEDRPLVISLDYFHTRFDNQAVIDMERDRNSVFFYNLNGVSYADAWQADLQISPFERFDILTAFRYNQSKITYTDVDGQQYSFEKPLTSRYRGLINIAYATPLRKLVFDFTAQINGPSRLPGLNGYDSQKRYSEAFPIYFAQITKNTKRFDVYIGSENLLDFRQKNPVQNWEAPFSRDFDASIVWGPIVGRKIYAGIRWRIGKLP